VNRVTLYRRFGDREGVVAALAEREGQRMRAALHAATADLDDPGDRLVEGFVAAVRYTNTHPLVRRAAEVEPETLIAAGLADDARLLRIGGDFLAAEIRQAQASGEALHLTDPEQAGETLARVFASFVLLPGGRVDLADEDAVRAYARGTLVPMVLGPR
jgi:AcrR family transcriptional regulator